MIHELRIYTANEGRMPELLARFRDHAMRLFEQHGIANVAYWLNGIGGRNDELWYILGFDDLAHREKAMAAFSSDPEWLKIRAESDKDGALVHHLENRILIPTEFSPLR